MTCTHHPSRVITQVPVQWAALVGDWIWVHRVRTLLYHSSYSYMRALRVSQNFVTVICRCRAFPACSAMFYWNVRLDSLWDDRELYGFCEFQQFCIALWLSVTRSALVAVQALWDPMMDHEIDPKAPGDGLSFLIWRQDGNCILVIGDHQDIFGITSVRL